MIKQIVDWSAITSETLSDHVGIYLIKIDIK